MAGVGHPAIGQLVEFRNYHLVPGAAEAFVEHFEAHFLESQEELGMDIVGQFQIVDDADRFVWVRRYLDPASRGESLGRFYTSPVWKEFGPRANEMMVDVSDVHLLVPHPSTPGFAAGHVPHAEQRGAAVDTRSTVVAACFELEARRPSRRGPCRRWPPRSGRYQASPSSVDLVTAGIANDFPALPIREDVVALWLLSDHEQGRAAAAVADAVGERADLSVHTLRLAPTRRSTLR